MKLTAFFFLVATLEVSAGSYAQNVTIIGKGITLDKIFKIIRKETGYHFIYDQSLLEQTTPLSLNIKDEPLTAALTQCLKGPELSFSIRNGAIVIFKEPEIITPPLPPDDALLPVGDLHGMVIDSSGAPLEGANVIILGTKTGTHTDGHGRFVLHNVSNEVILVVSFSGYESKTVHVRGNKEVFVSLKASVQPLDEQIVRAYGTTTRRYDVGSIAKVSSEEIESQPVMNPLAALEGRVPGLLVTTNTGNPGASFNIQIRGQNTINSAPGGNLVLDNPLFVIDGVPFAPQNGSASKLQTVDDITRVQTSSATTGLSPLNSLNPSDIESVEVLKDADATAIYGSRGANGVILITTKRGKASKTAFNGTVFTGVNHITRTLPLLNTQQYLGMRREAFANDGYTPNNTAGSSGYAPDLLLFDTTRHTDFVNTLFGREASFTSANASISGGSNTNTFFIGAGYDRQGYVYPGDYADNRISGNIALHHNSINRKLSIDFTSQYSYDHNMVPGAPSILSSFTLVPDMPSLLNPDGSIRWTYNGISLSTILGTFNNPLAYLNQYDNAQVYSLNSDMVLGYQILPGLSARINMGYSSFTSNEYSEYPLTAQNPANSITASAMTSNSLSYTWIIEPQLNYAHSFGKHRLDLLLGNSDEKMASANLTVSGSGFTNDLLLGSISSAGSTTSQQTYTPYKYSGSFSRINYIYNNRYILDVTGRVDGSSRFMPGRQWGKFGAAGAGWIFTEEPWVKEALPFLSFGKVKGSYGTTGDDNVGNYQYVSNWMSQSSGYVYNGSLGYIPNNLDNPNYSWSVTKKLEGGLETGWFSNRLLVSATWFRDRSGNQLIQYTLPTQTGFSYVTKNFQAVIQNTGGEFAVTSNNIKTKSLNWTTTFVLTIPHNKLLAFPGLAASSYAETYIVGRPISTVLGYKYAGLNDTTGVYQFYTTKGVKTYAPSAANGDNKFVLGDPDPKYYGGLRNTVSYKGFSLDLFLEFRKQSGFNYLSSVNDPFGYKANIPTDGLNYWKHPGDHAEYEKLTTLTYGAAGTAASVWNYYRTSTATYTDASYLRFKTVGLAYQLPGKLLKKAGMNGCKVYFNAQNLFTVTKYKGNDPETQNYYGTPPMRTITGGLQLSF